MRSKPGSNNQNDRDSRAMLGDTRERWHDRPIADLALQFQTDVQQG